MFRLVLYVLADWDFGGTVFTGHYGQFTWRISPLKASSREALALRNFRYPPTQSLVDWWVNPAGVQQTTFADFTQLGLFRCWGAPTFWCRVSNSAPTIPPKLRGRTAQEFTTALTKRLQELLSDFHSWSCSCEVHMFSDGTDLVTAVSCPPRFLVWNMLFDIWGCSFSSGLASPFPIWHIA